MVTVPLTAGWLAGMDLTYSIRNLTESHGALSSLCGIVVVVGAGSSGVVVIVVAVAVFSAAAAAVMVLVVLVVDFFQLVRQAEIKPPRLPPSRVGCLLYTSPSPRDS